MAKCCFGVDVGGTTVKIGFFNEAGVLAKKWEIPTRTEGQGAFILGDIADALKKEMEVQGLTSDDIAGVGMGLPGPVTDKGIVNRCVNLGWGVMDVEREFSQIFYDLPTKAANDANVAALGEAIYGGGRGYDSMVMVTLGTGVGGGVVLNGHIVAGAAGAAGEIGHMHFYPQAKKYCNCGNRGCLEQIASATGIVNRAKELIEETEYPSKLREVENITAKAVLDLHGQLDPIADEVLEEMVDSMGQALGAIGGVIDPQVFVIGGGVSKAGQWLIDLLQMKFLAYAFHACRGTTVRLAELGNDAGMYGAAAMIQQISE